jgi:hypothetical protein
MAHKKSSPEERQRYYVNMPHVQVTKNWYGHFHTIIEADSEENALEKALPPLKPEFQNIALELSFAQQDLDNEIILAQYKTRYDRLGTEKFYREILKSEQASRIQGQESPRPLPGFWLRLFSHVFNV